MSNATERKLKNLSRRLRLLTLANPKLAKGQTKGYLPAVLHLAPSDLSGHNVCPMAQRITLAVQGISSNKHSGCSLGCLNLAGRGGIAAGGILSAADVVNGARSNRIQAARVRRTRAYFEDRDAFMRDLVEDIRDVARVAAAVGLVPCVRLNGTSDIQWESVPVRWLDGTNAPNIMFVFPAITFYDYTKIAKRMHSFDVPSNYHLTLSRSEVNEMSCRLALKDGRNVAAVFAVKRGQPLPERYLGARVIDGDETDLRFDDPAGVVVGLRAKGPAIRDCSGFVVR